MDKPLIKMGKWYFGIAQIASIHSLPSNTAEMLLAGDDDPYQFHNENAAALLAWAESNAIDIVEKHGNHDNTGS